MMDKIYVIVGSFVSEFSDPLKAYHDKGKADEICNLLNKSPANEVVNILGIAARPYDDYEVVEIELE